MDDRMLWEMTMRERSLGLLVGPTAGTWLSVAFLAGLLIAAAFRPRNIASRGLFRTAVILFGLSVVLPALMRELVVLSSAVLSDNNNRGDRGVGLLGTITLRVFDVLGVIALGSAIVCGLMSFRVGRRTAPPGRPTAAAPRKRADYEPGGPQDPAGR